MSVCVEGGGGELYSGYSPMLIELYIENKCAI